MKELMQIVSRATEISFGNNLSLIAQAILLIIVVKVTQLKNILPAKYILP